MIPCPICGATASEVVKTRSKRSAGRIDRQRRCQTCLSRFWTSETANPRKPLMLTTTQNRISQQSNQHAGWKAELSAIADLQAFDCELFRLAIEQAASEVAEVTRALEAVTARLQVAKQQQAAVDARFAEFLNGAALLRKTLDEDSNFEAIHGDAAESAIQNVRLLRRAAH